MRVHEWNQYVSDEGECETRLICSSCAKTIDERSRGPVRDVLWSACPGVPGPVGYRDGQFHRDRQTGRVH